jgi:hypothetical protein
MRRASRVARWFIFEPNPPFWYLLEGIRMENESNLYDHLVYFGKLCQEKSGNPACVQWEDGQSQFTSITINTIFRSVYEKKFEASRTKRWPRGYFCTILSSTRDPPGLPEFSWYYLPKRENVPMFCDLLCLKWGIFSLLLHTGQSLYYELYKNHNIDPRQWPHWANFGLSANRLHCLGSFMKITEMFGYFFRRNHKKLHSINIFKIWFWQHSGWFFSQTHLVTLIPFSTRLGPHTSHNRRNDFDFFHDFSTQAVWPESSYKKRPKYLKKFQGKISMCILKVVKYGRFWYNF